MDAASFKESQFSGARITVPFTGLKQFSPRHHAIVIGTCHDDNETWVAELSRRHGYRIVALKQWICDNEKFASEILIHSNSGPRPNWEAARSALDEVLHAKKLKNKYNVIFNNCESFADRHLYGRSKLSPQIAATIKVAGIVVAGSGWLITQHLNRKSGGL